MSPIDREIQRTLGQAFEEGLRDAHAGRWSELGPGDLDDGGLDWRSLVAPAIAVVGLVLVLGVLCLGCASIPLPPGRLPPLRVAASDELLEDYADSLRSAIDAWNRAAGCVVVAWAIGRADVVVSIGPYRGDADGSYIPGGPARIYYRSPRDTRHAYVILAHELGHVLGLSHDTSRSSVMYPNVHSDLASSDRRQWAKLVPSRLGRRVAAKRCRQ